MFSIDFGFGELVVAVGEVATPMTSSSQNQENEEQKEKDKSDKYIVCESSF